MKYKINLLTHKKGNIVSRAFYFSLNYLRYILIITQLFAIGVFFYKVNIDQELADMSESVKQKQQILKISEPLVKHAQSINQKVKDVRNIAVKQEDFSQLLNYLLDIFPKGLTLTDLSISSKIINFKGKTNDAQLLQLFYKRLQKDQKFKNVRLYNIEKKQNEVHFAFSLNNT